MINTWVKPPSGGFILKNKTKITGAKITGSEKMIIFIGICHHPYCLHKKSLFVYVINAP